MVRLLACCQKQNVRATSASTTGRARAAAGAHRLEARKAQRTTQHSRQHQQFKLTYQMRFLCLNTTIMIAFAHHNSLLASTIIAIITMRLAE